MLNVKWVIIKSDRLPDGDDWIFFAVSPRDYENLSRDSAEFLRWAKEMQWQLLYYRGMLPAAE